MDIIYENKTSPIDSWTDRLLSGIPHFHKHFELVYVRKGRTGAYADGKRYMLRSGDLFLSFPNQIHYYETACPGEYLVTVFSPEILPGVGGMLSDSISDNNVLRIAGEEPILRLIDALSRADGPYCTVARSGYANVLMSLLLPRFPLHTVSAENNSALRRILNYCLHHFSDGISLDLAARELHLSKYYISHLIKQNLNLGFLEYLNNIRVGKACALLRETNQKIADISENVGFGTIRSFNRAFRQIMGISPGEYRNSRPDR